MANLRIVYDNAADRATVAASTTAGSLVASNLLTETKAQVWRSTSTSATLTLTWTDAELVGMLALPFCSLSSTATMRVRGYTETADVTPVIDTGIIAATAVPELGSWAWGTTPLSVNSYAYGGGTYAVQWFAQTPVKKIVVDLVDTSNPLGYIEASRLVTGTYWSPEHNCEYGVSVQMADTTKQQRTDAGDLRSDRGIRYKTLSIDLTNMPSYDRAEMWKMIRNNGLSRPMFVSVVPESDDSEEEHAYQVYGKMSKISAISYQFINRFNAPLELEEV